jgi:hypothetical protein
MRDISVTVTRRVGDPDLYITNDGSVPTRTHYQWSSSA